MSVLIFILVAACFIALVFLNVYFRVKVMKVYKRLVQNKVVFDTSHIFNRQKMQQEIYPRYPKFQQDIETFIRHIRYSIGIAVLLIITILILGAILVYYR